MRRRLIALGIVGFWAVMMATLARRWLLEVRPETVPGTYRSVLTAERENYHTRMGIFMPANAPGNTPGEARMDRVGHTETVLFYDSEDRRYTIRNHTHVRVPVRGLLQRLAEFDVDMVALVGQGHTLERLQVIVDSALGRAECNGQAVDGKLVLSTKVGAQEEKLEVPLPPGGMVASGLSPLVALPPLRVGMSWSTTVVDPLSLRPARVELEVLRRENLRWEGRVWSTHVVEIRSELFKALAWVSRDGEVLQERALFGLTLIKEPIPEKTGLAEQQGKPASDDGAQPMPRSAASGRRGAGSNN